MRLLDFLMSVANGLPNQLTYFVTSKCNGKCIHCFYWKSLNKKRDELTIDEIEKISKNINHLYWLYISGGEPFLRDDLAKICELFYKNNKVKSIVIPTNALLPEKIAKITEEILISCDKAKVTVNLSIDGLDSLHDKIRGVKGSFNKLLSTYKLLQKLKIKYHNFALGANIVCSKYNQEQLMDIYSFLKNKMAFDNINLSLIRGNPKDFKSTNVDLRYYKTLTEVMDNGYKQYTGFVHNIACAKDRLMHKIILKTVENKRQIIDCYACRTSAVIDEVGNVYPCEMLQKIGNLRENNYNFKEIWLSDNAKKIRDDIRNKKCFCTHECFISNSILSNIRMMPILLKEMVS
jgi:radical SAM protein with 4Fe4S-binding SPASM domain